MFSRTLKLSSIPLNNDLGLLLLRVLVCLNLFIKHGWEKLFDFNGVVALVPDILHIGVPLTIALALIGDSICSVLIMLGLATRWACMYSFAVIFVAMIWKNHFLYLGHNGDHVELMLLYLSALLAIFIMGPGRYSLDVRFKD